MFESALRRFIQLPSVLEAFAFLDAHLELLSEESDRLLGEYASIARANGEPLYEKMFLERLALLQHVRAVGLSRRSESSTVSEQEAPKVLTASISDVGVLRQEIAEASRQAQPEQWADLQKQLGIAYTTAFVRDGINCAALAVRAFRRALQVYTRASSPLQRALILSDLGAIYLVWSQRDERTTLYIERAIRTFHEALEILSLSEGLKRVETLMNLAAAYNHRIEGGRVDNLEVAIGAYEEVVVFLDPNHITAEGFKLWGIATAELAKLYIDRVKGLRNKNIEHAIALLNQALTYVSEIVAPLEWARLMYALAIAYMERTEGDLSINLERSLEILNILRTTLSRQINPLLYAQVSSALGSVYLRLSKESVAENIESAIEYFEEALQDFTIDRYPREWAKVTSNLANAYAKRIRGITAQNIETAIKLYEAAEVYFERAAMPLDAAQVQNNLINAYLNRIEGDRTENVEKSLAYAERALHVCTRNTNARAWAETLINQGNAFFNRIIGDRRANIEAAIQAYQTALEILTRETDPRTWAQVGNNLLIFYANRVEGDLASNTEHALSLSVQVLEVRTRSVMPMEWAQTMHNVGSLYAQRNRGDKVDNQERAIGAYEMALQVRTPDVSLAAWIDSTSDVAQLYADRIIGNRQENLKRAIDLLEKVLAAQQVTSDPVSWADTMYKLASVLRLSEDPTGLHIEQAIKIYEETLTVFTHAAWPRDWSLTMRALADSYRERYHGNRADNIEQAIEFYTRALTVIQANIMPVEWSQTINNLANAYRTRIRGVHEENIAEAEALYRLALSTLEPDLLPEHYRRIARNLGNLLFDQARWQEAVEAYHATIKATEVVEARAILHQTREDTFKVNGDLYQRAGYAMLRAGSLLGDVAVIFERGRARSLRRALAQQPDELRNLERTHPDLYLRMQELLTAQHVLESQARRFRWDWDTQEKDRTQLSDLTQQLQFIRLGIRDLWKVIRALPDGAEYSPSELNFTSIASAVQVDAPLVYLVTVPPGSVALLLFRQLPDADISILVQWIDTFTEADLYYILTGNVDGLPLRGWIGAYARQKQQRALWETQIEVTAQALWSPLMKPLLTSLETVGANSVVIIASGYLALLPLHVAYIDTGNHRQYALDTILFSYTPSAVALGHGQRTSAKVVNDHVLLVDMSSTATTPHLQYAAAEIAALTALHPRAHVLRQPEATVEQLLAVLVDVSIVHFSCHGVTDWENPLLSGLVLSRNQRLTVQDLLEHQLSGARFAALSACETGLVSAALPDEVVTLPSAFVQAGFAGVIASLWSVFDISTAMLMERFYRFWYGNGLTPVAALRAAQQWMRDTTNQQKADYYERSLAGPGDEDIIDGIASLYEFVAQRVPDERSFQHPVWWAAFYLTGV